MRKQFENVSSSGFTKTGDYVTPLGVTLKTLSLLAIMAVGVFCTFGVEVSGWFVIGLLLATFAMGIYISFNPKSAVLLAPLYALLEGGVIGFIFTRTDHEAVIPALLATFSTLGVVLILYIFRVLKYQKWMNKFVIIVLLTAIAFSLLTMFFDLQMSTLSYIISFVVIIAMCVSFITDFALIESMTGVEDASTEWYISFSILLSMIIMFLEYFKLFSGNDD